MNTAEVLGGFYLRRIVLPGAIAAVAIHPFVAGVFEISGAEGLSLDKAVALALEVTVLGMLFTLVIDKIIYSYEGFALPRLTSWMYYRHEQRIAKKITELSSLVNNAKTSADTHRLSVLERQLRDYPVLIESEGGDGSGGYITAERPTLLGNIIATYELYPQSRYGIDGVAFWRHILYLAPETARTDFYEKVAFAESVVLGSSAGLVTFVVGLLATLCMAFGSFFPNMVIGSSPISMAEALWRMIVGLMIFVGLYFLSLPLYRDVSSVFRALTDLSIDRVRGWLKRAPQGMPAGDVAAGSNAVRQYLEHLQ